MVKIAVQYEPECTWELDGDQFYCVHDEVGVVDCVEDRLGFGGHYEVEYRRYVCAECGEPLEGDPDEDYQEVLAESQLMEALGK